AIEDLRRVGAAVRAIGSEDFTLDPSGIVAVLDSRFTGKSSDLELLKQITNLEWLRIVNVPLDQQELATIGRLPGLARLDLIGTGISSEAAETLARQLPAGIRIDRRDGALLGVRGNAAMPACIIDGVEQGTAASDAGLQERDEITAFEGQPVRNFEELTALVSPKRGGEELRLETRRNGETLTKAITLGRWK